MKISVAIASYNGEKFIRQQLESILDQTLPVDEVIISDDGSKDQTVAIARSFRDDRIKIITGNPHPGYCGNFEWALKHTTGDIIFLADQDDIWFPEKVEKTARVFREDPKVELVISDGILIDKEGRQKDGVFSHYINQPSGRIDRDTFLEPAVKSALANGMCMCIGKGLLEEILPFPDSTAFHDRWIALCAVCRDSCYYLNEKLVGYRIHDTNTSMKGNIGFRQRIRRLIPGVYNIVYDLYNTETAILDRLKAYGLLGTGAETAAIWICDAQYKQIRCFEASCLVGVYRLLLLYFRDRDYRKNSIKYVMIQLYLLTFGRKFISEKKRTATPCD